MPAAPCPMKRAAAPFQPFRAGMSADGRNPLPVQIGARGARLPPLRAPFLPVPSVFCPCALLPRAPRPACRSCSVPCGASASILRLLLFAYPFSGRALSMSFCPCALLHRAPRPACRSASVPCLFGCDFSESPSSGAVSGRGFGVNLFGPAEGAKGRVRRNRSYFLYV